MAPSPKEILQATMEILESSNQPHQTVKICLNYMRDLIAMLDAEQPKPEPTAEVA